MAVKVACGILQQEIAMNDPFPDPYRVPDAAALAQARAILETARDAVLSVLDPEGWPMVSRWWTATGCPDLPRDDRRHRNRGVSCPEP